MSFWASFYVLVCRFIPAQILFINPSPEIISDTMKGDVGIIPPPPRIAPNFDHPESIGHELMVLNFVLPPISTCIVLLRLYSRYFIVRVIGSEDCE